MIDIKEVFTDMPCSIKAENRKKKSPPFPKLFKPLKNILKNKSPGGTGERGNRELKMIYEDQREMTTVSERIGKDKISTLKE